jgi:hypothetical protein
VVGIVIAHILLVRKHGVVPPFKLPARVAPASTDGQRADGTELATPSSVEAPS